MMIVSAKVTKKKIIIGLGILAAILMMIILLVPPANGNGPAEPRHKVTGVKTNDDRVAFLTSFGWEISREPLEFMEAKMPEEFDEVYRNYNEMQKKQGFDLEKYKGKRVMRYTFEVLNYPGATERVLANILMYKDTVIGGDICSERLDGFMHGFAMPG